MKKKHFASLALGAVLAAAPAAFLAGSPAEAGGSKIPSPPDCGSHVRCPGDPAPDPRAPIVAHNCVVGVPCDDTPTPPDDCAAHIRCPDGGDGGVDPRPDDDCVPGRCNYDSPHYGESDVLPPNDQPGSKVEKPSTKAKAKAKSKTDHSVKEATAPKAVKAQPHTVG